jgi:hypothetical protein
MPAMRNLLLLLALVAACGGDDKKTVDAAPPADVAIDTATVAPSATAYCTDIIAHCTGANAQYPTTTAMDQCLGTAASFPVGKTGETSGNTLGCRAYHAGAPAMTDPATHCIHAGPGGDQVTSAAGTCGDACTSFCNLEIKTCGSLDAPLTGITAQYQNQAACMTACGTFNKTAKYVLNSTQAAPSGNSLACRLYHATNAAYYTKIGDVAKANTHCGHTGDVQTTGLPCNGTPAP